jgi:quercetin dioxygenase-like cupin family protein
MKTVVLLATAASIVLSTAPMAQEKEARVTPDALAWKENPAFPKGVQIATLVGDPSKTGEVVVLRIKFPANFQMPPHTHPYSEVVTLEQIPVNLQRSRRGEDRRHIHPW